MRFATIRSSGSVCLATPSEDGLFVLFPDSSAYRGDLDQIVATGAPALAIVHDAILRYGRRRLLDEVEFLPPLRRPAKIICVGLNYVDHTAESGFVQPEYPTLFARFASSLAGDGQAIIRPDVSEQFDYEGELAVVIGRGGRDIPRDTALDHVLGYSVFNDVSVRDFQFKSPQWTAGKNFDGTGVFGPFLVTADELPPGCKGLMLETRLNGKVVQRAPIGDMVFDVAELISILSAFMTLEPGDVIVSGTPAGVGMAHKPPLWMRPGDRVEVEIGGLGTLSNRIVGA